jgi:(4S)-4-hydroxy-5-phosphonooxypentane-2,3-dione isomerase
MNRFAITVDFELKAGALTAFRALIDRNAADSCRLETGCRRFDVLVPDRQADRVLLYEIYDDRAAFDAHLATSHFKAFNRDSGALVINKKVEEFELVCEGSQG